MSAPVININPNGETSYATPQRIKNLGSTNQNPHQNPFAAE